MSSATFVLCVVFVFFSSPIYPHVVEKNASKFDCKQFCVDSGSQAELNAETHTCQCILPKNLDDVDLALINKNALLIEKTTNNTRQLHEKSKRNIAEIIDSTTPNSATLPSPPPPTEPTTVSQTTTASTVQNDEKEDKSEFNLNPEGIVGQAPANRRGSSQRVVGPQRQRAPRPITLDQQRLISQQIHDHLNRLNQISDQRIREVEIQAIKSNLRQLSNTVLNSTPQQRTRMRNIVEDSRRRQNRPRLLHSRIVGAPFPNFAENSTEKQEVHGAIKEIFHGKRRHEIITQDPRLIDD